MKSGRREAEMAARRERWSEIVARAEASGMPIRRFCEKHGVNEGQFYHWRYRLRLEDLRNQAGDSDGAEFVLVRPATATGAATAEAVTGGEAAALELTLDGGWRLRISRGVDEATLPTVLAARR